MSSRADSSASTISGSSTAAPRFPPAATWSRRTARHGWPCLARTCSNSRWSFPPTAPDPTYEPMLTKFAEHFFYIARGMNRPGHDSMWDEEDGFYYDLLRLPDGSATRLKVRSMVGLLPLCATTVVEKWQRERVPRAMAGLLERLRR